MPAGRESGWNCLWKSRRGTPRSRPPPAGNSVGNTAPHLLHEPGQSIGRSRNRAGLGRDAHAFEAVRLLCAPGEEALNFLLDFCVSDTKGEGIIEISAGKEAGIIKIIVKEKGSIDFGNGQDIFTPFSGHLSALTSLNLAICRKIIEEQRGSIHFENLPDSVRRFILTLPGNSI